MATKYADRTIPKISLHDFDSRIEEITSQLIHAAETDGFFGLINHGMPSKLSTVSSKETNTPLKASPSPK